MVISDEGNVVLSALEIQRRHFEKEHGSCAKCMKGQVLIVEAITRWVAKEANQPKEEGSEKETDKEEERKEAPAEGKGKDSSAEGKEKDPLSVFD